LSFDSKTKQAYIAIVFSFQFNYGTLTGVFSFLILLLGLTLAYTPNFNFICALELAYKFSAVVVGGCLNPF
jgi:hypothetical protein